ncbi:tail protein [Vibrio phage K436]
MSYDRPLPSPVLGISTLPVVTRPEGYASKQVNWRNDMQNKLTRRPPTWHVQDNLDVSCSFVPDAHLIEVEFVDGQRYEIHAYAKVSTREVEVVIATTSVRRKTVQVGADWFVGGVPDLGISIALGSVYVWNKNCKVKVIKSRIDKMRYESVALVNITSALNYAEEVTLSIVTDGVLHSEKATWLVPGLTSDNQADADAKRATNRVATELANQMADRNKYPMIRWAKVQGSNIYVEWMSQYNTCRLEVSTGRGDSSIVVMNHEVSDIIGLPKYCFPETVRAVIPDPTSDDGRYYLVATALDVNAANKMEEVVWTETEDPTSTIRFNTNTLPIVVDDIRDTTLDMGLVNWTMRDVGDDDSNPVPDFVDKTIANIGDFQDRLLVLSADKVVLSKTDNPLKYWKDSAIGLLVTDTTSVGTSKSNSTLEHVVFHNRDLIVFAENAQFKIDGQNPVTPQTVAMPIVTENECDLNVPPVLMNAAVFYASSYGDSAGVRRLEVEANTVVDKSVSMTDHVVGLMPGGMVEMASNANQTMLVCRTADNNKLYVFEQQHIGDTPVYAWSEWELPTGVAVRKMSVYNEELWILYDDAGTLRRMTANLKPSKADVLHMDCQRLATVEDDGTIKADGVLSSQQLTAVINSGRERWAYMTLTESSPGVLTPDDYLEPGTSVTLGYTYESLYEPSTIYERNRDGSVRSTDRLRIVHHILELSNTYHLICRVLADYWDVPDQEFTSLRSSDDDMASKEQYTGQWKPQIGMQNDDCRVQYITDKPYPATIATISYRGQQYSTRTRR